MKYIIQIQTKVAFSGEDRAGETVSDAQPSVESRDSLANE